MPPKKRKKGGSVKTAKKQQGLEPWVQEVMAQVDSASSREVLVQLEAQLEACSKACRKQRAIIESTRRAAGLKYKGEDAVLCDGCTNTFDPNGNDGGTCSGCADGCKKGPAPLCSDCSFDCAECGSRVCEECRGSCSQCDSGDVLCDSCASRCYRCDSTYCGEHIDFLKYTGEPVCIDCLQ